MHIKTIRTLLSSLPSQTPGVVALVVGGTSGIGEATVRSLASHLGPGSRIYIVGRNADAARKIIDECLDKRNNGNSNKDGKDKSSPSKDNGTTMTTTPTAAATATSSTSGDLKMEFLRQDVSLLKNVDELCRRFAEKEPKLDILFMTQGYLSLEGRNETSEKIDDLLSLRYYSRMLFAVRLLPQLEASSSPRVVSIYAPGVAERFASPDLTDLGLSRPGNYTFLHHMSHPSYMTTLFMSRLSSLHPTVSFLHVYPGWVITPEWQVARFPAWLRWTMVWLVTPILRLWSQSYGECGDRMVWNCFGGRCPPAQVAKNGADAGGGGGGGDSEEGRGEGVGGDTRVKILDVPEGTEVMKDLHGNVGGGAYCVDYLNEPATHYRNMTLTLEQDGEEKVWRHTMDEFERLKVV